MYSYQRKELEPNLQTVAQLYDDSLSYYFAFEPDDLDLNAFLAKRALGTNAQIVGFRADG